MAEHGEGGVVDVVAPHEAWLQRHPPQTLLALADRLLIASVDRSRREGPLLAQRFVADVVVAAGSEQAVPAFTTLCVCTSALEELGVDVAELRYALAQVARVVVVDGWQEPFRSTARYWLWRAGLARSFVDDGAAPADARLAFAFHSHRVLFATRYGQAPDDDAPGWTETRDGVDVDCSDSVARRQPADPRRRRRRPAPRRLRRRARCRSRSTLTAPPQGGDVDGPPKWWNW